MHYHLEIIMPPTHNVESAVEKILAPFDENSNDENSNHPFWDWFTLGGRYSGYKIKSRVGSERIKAFRTELNRLGVTVSGLVVGKQELSPASQINAVDKLWREMCPNGGDTCPIFQHSGDAMDGDICTLAELPNALQAFSAIIATPQYDDKIGAETMLHKSIWNGVMYQDTDWKGSVPFALQVHADRINRMNATYAEARKPKPDWLVVTVDYHS